uniref:Uncharacterized protein n=1 Tax=Cannabis sativa TaxID=3483 RepID=A0A803Q1L2_CANSA
MAIPPTYIHVSSPLNNTGATHQPGAFFSDSTLITTLLGVDNTSNNTPVVPLAHDTTSNVNRLSSLFSKRKLVTSGGNVHNVLKRWRTKATPLANSTSSLLHEQLITSLDFSNLSSEIDGSNASLEQADVHPHQML